MFADSFNSFADIESRPVALLSGSVNRYLCTNSDVT